MNVRIGFILKDYKFVEVVVSDSEAWTWDGTCWLRSSVVIAGS